MNDSDLLLRLKRQYSKDETVSLLLIEIGTLKSEIAELQYKLEQQKTSVQESELLRDESFIKLSKADKKQYYVTSKRYNKQVKLTDYFIDLYHKEKDKNSRVTTIGCI